MSERLSFLYRLSFRSPWRRLTWLVWGATFLAILLFTGVVDHLPAQVRYPLPPGTVRFSYSRAYLVIVLTPHLVLNLVAVQLGKAALLALGYAMNVTLTVAQSRPGCCRALGLGSIGMSFGAVGLSFCCGPLAALTAAVGLAPLSAYLWELAIVLLTVSLLFGPEQNSCDLRHGEDFFEVN